MTMRKLVSFLQLLVSSFLRFNAAIDLLLCDTAHMCIRGLSMWRIPKELQLITHEESRGTSQMSAKPTTCTFLTKSLCKTWTAAEKDLLCQNERHGTVRMEMVL